MRVLYFLLFSIIIFFTGCTDTADKKESVENSIHELSFGMNIGEGSAMFTAAKRFAEEIKAETNGKVIINLFPNQTLGTDQEMLDMATNGNLDILLIPTAKLSILIPEMQYADMPFLFPTKEDAYNLLDGAVGDVLLSKLKRINLAGVTFWENGFKQFTSNKPVNSPDDFSDMKVRIMKSPLIFEQFKSMNAIPIPIDFHKTYDALKDGFVTGEENPVVAIYKMKFHEVQKYMTISNHAYLCYVFAFSDKSLNKLPKEYQDLLIKKAKSLTSFQREETARIEKDLLTKIKNSGTKINTLTQKEIAEFTEATSNVRHKFESIIGTNIMNMTKQYLIDKYGSKLSKNYWIIGINASMSGEDYHSGNSIYYGVSKAVKDFNKKFRIQGKKIKLLSLDHMTVPARGAENLRSMAKMDNLLAVVGGKHSPVSLSLLDETHDKKIPYLMPWAAGKINYQELKKPYYFFRLSLNDKHSAPMLAEKALIKSSKIGIVYLDTLWGRNNSDAIENYLAEKNIIPVFKQAVSPDRDKAYQELLSKATANAEVIIFIGNIAEFYGLTDFIKEKQHNVSIVSHWGITHPDVIDYINKNKDWLNVEILQTLAFSKVTDDFQEDFKNTIFTKNLKSTEVSFSALQAYDLISMMLFNIKDLDVINGETIRSAMENVSSFQGLIKLYNKPFSPNDHDALEAGDVIFTKVNNEGKLTISE